MTGRQGALLGVIGALWGSSYLLIKYALEGFSPSEVVFWRVAVASLTLAVVLRAQGAPWRAARAELTARPRIGLGLGLVSVAAPILLIAFGERSIPSGLTAVLVAPAPLFVALFASRLDSSESVDGRQWIGLVAGVAGVALVVGLEAVGTVAQFAAALGLIAASACYAVGGFVVKGAYRGVPPIITSFISLAAAALLCLVPALLTQHPSAPGLRAVLAVLALGVTHTALAFVIFYKLIGEVGAGRSALVTYLSPGFALVYGAVLLDERITVPALAGLGLILGGVALASRRAAVSPSATVAPPAASRSPTR